MKATCIHFHDAIRHTNVSLLPYQHSFQLRKGNFYAQKLATEMPTRGNFHIQKVALCNNTAELKYPLLTPLTSNKVPFFNNQPPFRSKIFIKTRTVSFKLSPLFLYNQDNKKRKKQTRVILLHGGTRAVTA